MFIKHVRTNCQTVVFLQKNFLRSRIVGQSWVKTIKKSSQNAAGLLRTPQGSQGSSEFLWGIFRVPQESSTGFLRESFGSSSFLIVRNESSAPVLIKRLVRIPQYSPGFIRSSKGGVPQNVPKIPRGSSGCFGSPQDPLGVLRVPQGAPQESSGCQRIPPDS